VTVFDASAILAYLADEPGSETVAAALVHRGAISAVNWAEVLTRLAVAGISPDDPAARELVAGPDAPLTVIPFDEPHARETARLKTATSGVALSLGDRACLALARMRHATVLTTDRAWRSLKLKIKTVVIR
jgi:PIN domain nuclease of toxin-antitoxin system